MYPERSDYIISEYKDPWIQGYSTDICRLVCDLAYLPKSIAYDLEFDEEKIYQLMLKLRRSHVQDTEGDEGHSREILGTDGSHNLPKKGALSALGKAAGNSTMSNSSYSAIKNQ